MTIEQKLYEILTANSGVTDLVSTRVYPGSAPDKAVTPYIAYKQVQRKPIKTHNNYGGSSGTNYLRNVEILIEVLSFSYRESREIAEAVLAALDGYRESETCQWTSSLTGEHGTPEYDDTRLKGYVMTFDIWASL